MEKRLWITYIDCVNKKILRTETLSTDFRKLLDNMLAKRPNDILSVKFSNDNHFRGKIKWVDWLAEETKARIYLVKIGDEIAYLEMKDREKYEQRVANYIAEV